ncbi:glycosyltransferase family 1 protein [Serratia nevei]|uniref:glycosyltransferase family 4 protein n=1 Tax=Serratia TaxID=613 RepID=UPI00217BFF0B|nr:glycosyltransferase family 1 protein [Serratia marcescens]CAI1598898.1 Glycogen synthase [Serratia marcescens]
MLYVNARFLEQELTGVQRFAEEICLELKKTRKDIVFLCPPNILREDVAQQLDAKKIGGRGGHFWEQFELPSFLKKEKDAILLNLGSSAPIFFKNKIVTHHDVTYKRYPESFSRKFRALYSILIPSMLRSCRHLITVSEFSKMEISQVYNFPLNKTTVVYNAVSKKFAVNNSLSKGDYILAVSSPNYHKNFHGLLKAYLMAQNDGANLPNLKIIGSASSSFCKVNFSDQLAGRQDIEFVGRVSDDELISLYQKAVFFVFPSLYEGFGIPPIEAQSCGCPVISSNRASMPEVLEQSVVYFDPENIDEIAKALTDLSHDHEKKSLLLERGLKNVNRFSWKASAEKISTIIDKIILDDKVK